MSLHPLDVAIVLAYLVAVLAVGLHFARRRGGTEDYFLAGRRLGFAVVGLSMFASNISSTTLVGLSGSAYATGISISNYEWMASVVLVFFAVFFIPYYLSSRIYTIPEFLERRFRPACRYYFSGVTILGNVFIDTAGTLYAGCLVLRLLFPGVELWQSALVLALVAGLYTAAGGLAAVVFTDVIQAVILLVGSTAIALLSLRAAGSWGAVADATPPEFLSMIRPLDDPTMPWLGTLVGVPILGFYFWCTNQFIVQRVLGARDIHHARWGALLAALLKLPVLYLMVFPGVIARQLYPSLERPDLVFPTLLQELLPTGFRGLVLAGLVAAIMSSIDSTLNSASTLVTMDFVRKLRPAASDRTLARVGRVVTLVFMVVSAVWVPVVARAATIFEYLQRSLAYLFPPVVAVFLLGLFWKRASGTGALAGLVAGHVIALAVFVLQQLGGGLARVHFLVLAGGFLLAAALVMVVVSLATAPPSPEQVRRFTWSRESMAEATAGLRRVAWYQDYRLLSALLLLLTGALVFTHR